MVALDRSYSMLHQCRFLRHSLHCDVLLRWLTGISRQSSTDAVLVNDVYLTVGPSDISTACIAQTPPVAALI